MQKSSLSSLEKTLNFPVKVVGFSWKNRQIFSQKQPNFLSKMVKILRKNYQIFLLKLSTFPRKIERMRSIEWFQRTSIIACFFSFFFIQQNNYLWKVFVGSYLFVPISAYNYFYMIEIIRAVRSIIPATELTFLSLHMYLYSKGHKE